MTTNYTTDIQDGYITPAFLRIIPSRQLTSDVISSDGETIQNEVVVDHTAEPIKSVDDINRISSFLVKNKRYRDNMLFIVGINFGLRVSDLLSLRFSSIINDDLSFKTEFAIFEKKTRNTRKVKKNRYITINDAVVEAVTLYLVNCPSKLNDYMFRSQSNNKNGNNPLSRMAVDNILKGIARDCNIDAKVSSHTLRKTFGYHQMMMGGNDPRKLLVLQKMFGHSTSSQTLDYIGITNDEMTASYADLNLGGRNCYAKFSNVHEREVSSDEVAACKLA